MYMLVDDIDSYAAFLPWCEHSSVLERSAGEVLAQLRIAVGGVGKSFTTRNRLTPFSGIQMTLVEGPFSALSGGWAFTPLRAEACRVELNLQFAFANPLTAAAVGPVFTRIADSLVDSFVKRAAAVYGSAVDAPVDAPGKISVEVVYARPEGPLVEQIIARPPLTIADALRAWQLRRSCPPLDLATVRVGVFGLEHPLDWPLQDQDRVEIYRPLHLSPGEARRRRATASSAPPAP